jgi:hypothetical protein
MALAPAGLACGGVTPPDDAGVLPLELRINEVVSNNEGVWVDELGETDDYVEVFNASDRVLELGDYALSDGGRDDPLPARELVPGAVLVLWADGTPEQGELHLPFRISATGETLRLVRRNGTLVDQVQVPALGEHHAFLRLPDGIGAFVDCAYATPARKNGERCGPTPPADLPKTISFAPFTWPDPFPPLPSPLSITELAFRPAEFVEVLNRSSEPVELANYQLRVASHRPGVAWPDRAAGVALEWPVSRLAAGERVAVSVSADDLAPLEADPAFEGVVSIWAIDSTEPVERIDFRNWPEGKTLARFPDPGGRHRFCAETTPGVLNASCAEALSRTVGDRLRHLRTPSDFAELARGRAQLGTGSVEFVIDLESGGVVTLLNSADWDLHYTFVREAIQGLPHLNRCDPNQYAEYLRGWWTFSVDQYFEVEGNRRYLLGTLVEHAGSGLHTVEFAAGDQISAAQMKQAFFTVMEHVEKPDEWFIRPQATDQIERLRAIEAEVPVVEPDAPFRGVTYQPLTAATAFGTLRFVSSGEIAAAALGPRDLLLTDQVPNDIPLLAGLITETFQTPLAHVNVLSRGRGTPNMGLRNARQDARIAPHIGELVRLEVRGEDFSLVGADPAEAVAYWQSRQPSGPLLVPRLDTGLRGVQALAQHSILDLPALGGKAAQLAELGRVLLGSASSSMRSQCLGWVGSGKVDIPSAPAAVPVVHSLEHYRASGAQARLEELRQDANFTADPQVRAQGLFAVRSLILAHPVDSGLLAEIDDYIAEHWPGSPTRLRSSSNTEDLPTFNGAGLYQSTSIDASDSPEALADALRRVWASLYDLRAYDEREYYRVDQSQVAMAVLMHPAFHSERANGVAISRNVVDPGSAGREYYFNVQVGEALVTNPAPAVMSDELTFDPLRVPHLAYYSASTLSSGGPVLSESEVWRIACNLSAIHQHFRPLLDPAQENAWFAMDIEFKLMGDERSLVIKQARPYSFGNQPPSGWCDF